MIIIIPVNSEIVLKSIAAIAASCDTAPHSTSPAPTSSVTTARFSFSVNRRK